MWENICTYVRALVHICMLYELLHINMNEQIGINPYNGTLFRA